MVAMIGKPDWYLLGFQSGKLGNLDNPLPIDKQVYLASIATCIRLQLQMPAGSYAKFNAGYRAGLQLSPLEPVRRRMKLLGESDWEQLDMRIRFLLDRGVPVQEIADNCNEILDRWTEESCSN
jgi:hypothetical protein